MQTAYKAFDCTKERVVLLHARKKKVSYPLLKKKE